MRLRHALGLALAAATVLGSTPAEAGARVAAAGCAGLPKHASLPVVDAAGVIPADAEQWLNADLLRHNTTSDQAFVAATVADLGGDDISSYARRLFDCWGVGEEESDNGVLILVAMRERRVRIELGAGLEGRLPEEKLDLAIEAMAPPLKRGEVAAGLRAAAVSLVDELGGELPDTQAEIAGNMPGTGPEDVEDPVGIREYPGGGLDPFASRDSGRGLVALVPILFVVGLVVTVVRSIMSGGGASFGSGSAWRGGFPGHGTTGWSSPSVLHGGSWHDAGSSGGGSSGSSGGSGGGSFGGGSSGGGGASGSW